MAKTVRLKLNRYLDERRISRYALAKMSGIKYQTIDHYYKNWVVRYDSATLGEIITALDCGIEDILEVVEEEEPEEPGGPRHMAGAGLRVLISSVRTPARCIRRDPPGAARR